MINANIKGHAVWDGFCHIHREKCSITPGPVDQALWATVADIDYAVAMAGCSHNYGTYQCGSVDVNGRTLHYYCCSGPNCGIILRGPC